MIRCSLQHTPVTCPKAFMAVASLNRPPNVPRSRIVAPSHRKACWGRIASQGGTARHLPGIIHRLPKAICAAQRAEILHDAAVPKERMAVSVACFGSARDLPRGIDGLTDS